MSRTIRRSATVVCVSLLAGALALCATALAAKPKKNARFSGTLKTTIVEGFRAPVTFKVSGDGKQLQNFTFGSFGCFGAGGFRPGVNPYTGHSLINVGTLKLAKNGQFSQTKPSSYTVSGQTTSFTVKVSGRFSTRTSAIGTIQFTESVSGGPGKCTSLPLAFSASS